MSTPSLYGGDGLIRPINAPQGQQVLPGVQPGVTGGVVLATYVIIFGTNGGMFVYNGSPGPGNPPVYSVSNATSDPYGNAIAPGIWAGQFGQTQAGLEASGPAGQLLFPVAGTSPLLVGGVSGVAAGTGAEVQIFGPQDSGAGNNDRVFMVFGDHLAVGSSAAYFLDYLDANGTTWVQVQGGNAGLFLSTVTNLTAVLPGTGTSSVNPAQPETWHTATLINGWAGGGNENGLFYRLLPLGASASGTAVVEVKADIINAGGAPANSVAAILPAAYRPITNQNHQAGVNFPQANNSASLPWISVAAANGNLQVTGLQAAHSTAEVFFHIFIPLGTL